MNFTIFAIKIGNSQNYKITHYGVNEGLSSNCVYHCTQDSLGLIWVATDNGLTRFDGKKFKYFGITDGLKKNEVFHIQPISKDILLGYNLNHCFIIDNGRIKFPVSEIYKVNALTHFYTDVYDTKIVVSKKDSILIFNKENFKLFSLKKEVKNMDVLYQSIPNPTDDVALINYILSQDDQDAYISVFSNEGKQLKTIRLESKIGEGNIKISLTDLSAGVYSYSLIIGGKFIDTKRLQIIK